MPTTHKKIAHNVYEAMKKAEALKLLCERMGWCEADDERKGKKLLSHTEIGDLLLKLDELDAERSRGITGDCR